MKSVHQVQRELREIAYNARRSPERGKHTLLLRSQTVKRLLQDIWEMRNADGVRRNAVRTEAVVDALWLIYKGSTVTEAAEAENISRKTLYRWLERGVERIDVTEVPPYKEITLETLQISGRFARYGRRVGQPLAEIAQEFGLSLL